MIGIFNSKSKIIKAELDPVLEKLGYPKLKRGDVDKGRIWISEKNTGGLTQKITIQEVYNILNIDLRTNVYAAKMIRVDEKEGILSEYSCVMKSHFRKFGNQNSGTRKSPILCLMTYPFLLGYLSRPCRICGA